MLAQKFHCVQSKSPVCVCQSHRLCFSSPVQDLLHLEERLGTVNRGASQGTIERCTYPHKYKKVRICVRACVRVISCVYINVFLQILYIVVLVCYSVFWDRVRSGLLCSFQASDVL